MRQTLEWVTNVFSNMGLLDIALDHLSLGRAHLGLALTAPESAVSEEDRTTRLELAAEHMDRAVDGLRRATHEESYPEVY